MSNLQSAFQKCVHNMNALRILMQLLYDNAIYFLLHRWVNEKFFYREEDIQKARRILQEKYSYSE